MGNVFTNLNQRLFNKKELKILMIGLDGGGKTAILYRLKLEKFVEVIPTIGFNKETIEYNNVNFTITDAPYRNRLVRVWRDFFPKYTQHLIFVVDSTDRSRIDEAESTLMYMLFEDSLKDAVVLILANKKDLPNAMNAKEIEEKLDLHRYRHHKWYVQETSAINGEGLYEGLDWLANQVNSVERS